jgi:homoserine dehydrogenase
MEIRYAIAGFGNVGAAVARHVAERRATLSTTHGVDLRLVAAVDSTGAIVGDDLDALALADARDAGQRLASHARATRSPAPRDLLARGVDCLVVALPTNLETAEPGLTWARDAIAAGAHVVLADKGPALVALPELEAAAAARALRVAASATVGSALPTLSIARRELAGAELREIAAILNGTTNAILTLMREDALSFDEALARAVRDGIAEPDPRFDVEGWDAAVKLTILSRALFDAALSLGDVERSGIDEIDPAILEVAARDDRKIRLVARARRTPEGVRLSVAPEPVSPDDPFYLVDGARKAIRFVTREMGDLWVMGGASGRQAVAAVILKDILETSTGARR